jgi:hypothetical protein
MFGKSNKKTRKVNVIKMIIHQGCDKLKSTHYISMEVRILCAVTGTDQFYASPHYESSMCPKLIACMHRDNICIVAKEIIFGLHYVILFNQKWDFRDIRQIHQTEFRNISITVIKSQIHFQVPVLFELTKNKCFHNLTQKYSVIHLKQRGVPNKPSLRKKFEFKRHITHRHSSLSPKTFNT